jgi:amino acid permease
VRLVAKVWKDRLAAQRLHECRQKIQAEERAVEAVAAITELERAQAARNCFNVANKFVSHADKIYDLQPSSAARLYAVGAQGITMFGDTETTQTSPQLVRALKLRDLVLFNLVAVLGLRHLGTTAKFGPGSLLMWLIAAVFFFIPQGLAVIELSSRFPKEGGIYFWTKRALGEGHGFLCGWCYWINNVLYYPIASMHSHCLSPSKFSFRDKYIHRRSVRIYHSLKSPLCSCVSITLPAAS